MATFFLGQRVKLVRAFDGVSPSAQKAEGLFYGYGITDAGFVFPDGFVNPSECDCYVVWDGLPGPHSQHTDQLEPILPDGHRAGDYSLSELLDRCTAGEGVAA
jgi:hypothetical protein